MQIDTFCLIYVTFANWEWTTGYTVHQYAPTVLCCLRFQRNTTVSLFLRNKSYAAMQSAVRQDTVMKVGEAGSKVFPTRKASFPPSLPGFQFLRNAPPHNIGNTLLYTTVCPLHTILHGPPIASTAGSDWQ